MSRRIVRVLIALLAATGNLHAENIDLGTVIFANILYRHGDRTPVRPYPNDPYSNASLWPVPFGQLTNVGKHQHLMLGRWLRNRYSHLITESYTPDDIYVESTDVDRTLMSAEVNLAGLYPPRGNDRWDNTLNWIPIPVHTIPQHEDYVLAAKKYCPRYNFEMSKVLQSPEIKRIDSENAELYRYLTKYSGQKIADLQSVEYLYNDLYIETIWNKTLPEWTKSVYPEKLKHLAEFSFTLPAYNKILQRLKTGSLVGQMVEHMQKKSNGALVPDQKLWVYSAHDETVANLLMTLDVFEPHCPPYASTVLVELRENSKRQHIVTVSYKNTSGDPMLLTIPGCLTACPLHDFVKLTKAVVPENWERECLIDSSIYGYNVSNSAIIAILAWSVLFLISLILMIFAFIYSQYRRENSQYYLRLSTDPI